MFLLINEECFNHHRLSVSNDLKYDAMRDLKDIGASNIPVHSLTKFKYAKINSKENGYCKKGVIFSTYSGLIGETHSRDNKYRSRLKQLLHWCGKDFDGCVSFYCTVKSLIFFMSRLLKKYVELHTCQLFLFLEEQFLFSKQKRE